MKSVPIAISKNCAPLFKTKPAYDAFDDAYEAYTEKNYSKSRRLLRKAKSIEPREALFDMLEGDIVGRPGQSLCGTEKLQPGGEQESGIFSLRWPKRGAK